MPFPVPCGLPPVPEHYQSDHVVICVFRGNEYEPRALRTGDSAAAWLWVPYRLDGFALTEDDLATVALQRLALTVRSWQEYLLNYLGMAFSEGSGLRVERHGGHRFAVMRAVLVDLLAQDAPTPIRRAS